MKYVLAGSVLFCFAVTAVFILAPTAEKSPVVLAPSEPNDEAVNAASIKISGFENQANGIIEIWGDVKNVNPEKVKIVILERCSKNDAIKESIICQPNSNGKWQAFGFMINTEELICLIMPYSYEKKIRSQSLDSYLQTSLANVVYNKRKKNCYFATP